MITEASSDADTPSANPTPPPTPPTANLGIESSVNSPSFSLDSTSWEHVQKLCDQLLSCSKVNGDIYRVPLLDALRSFAGYLTPELLSRLARSKGAQARAAMEFDDRRGSAKGVSEGQKNAGVWWISTGRSSLEGGESDSAEKERRREIWRNAAMLLSTPDDEVDETGGALRTHLRDISTMSISDPDQDEAWLEVDAMSKTPILSILLETNETTMAAVNSKEASLGVMFAPGVFEGVNLFGRNQQQLDKEDLELVERLGGTFRLTTTKKNLPRLERIIEFLAFSVVTLSLEAQLLSDLSCPRPPPISSMTASYPSPPLQAMEFVEEQEAGETSLNDLKLPGAYEPDFDDDDEEPDDDWGHTKRSWRSSFGNKGVLAWMRLANHPRTQLLSPIKSERSLRRSSTITSNRQSSRDGSLAGSAPNSPSPSPSAKRGKVANKLRGIRDQLRGRISGSDAKPISRDGSDGEEDVPVKRGGNVGMLGLQIAGVNHNQGGGWSLPWSNTESKDDELHVEEVKDTASTAGTEVTMEGERQPPKRFEKVIEDLSNFILSTSPDVCYPPPHLLTSLREKELAASSNSPAVTPLQIPSTPPSPSLSTPYVFDELYDRDPIFPTTTRSTFLNPRTSALQRAHALPSSHSLALNFAGGHEHEPEKLLMPEERRTANTSTATRIALDARAGLASLMTNNSSLGGTIRHQAMQFLVQTVLTDPTIRSSHCEPYRWLTFNYFENSGQDQGAGVDPTLEGFVRAVLHHRDDKCNHCDRSNNDHTIIFLHHNEKIEISVSSLESIDPQPILDGAASKSSKILQWHTCSMCQATTIPTTLCSTSSSFSFAKFLELLLYDSNLIPVPKLCDHAATERTALVRSFALDEQVVQLRRSSVPLYELRLPTAIDPDVLPDNGDDMPITVQDSLENLRDEIESFFRSARTHVNTLRHRLTTLPPSPPESPERPPPTSLQEPTSPSQRHVRSDSEQTIIDISTRIDVPSISQIVEEDLPPSSETVLLRKLSHFIDTEETACREALVDLAPGKLNIGRSAFEVKAKALKRRIQNWTTKHSEVLRAELESTSPSYDEPDYFSDTVLALPLASSVLLRTDEISSLLAVALSTDQFKEECQTVSAASSRRVTPSTPSFLPKSRQSSVRLPIPTFAAFVDSAIPLDPDDPYADYSSPTPFEILAKPKKPPRSSGSMFRNLVRKKSGEISSPSTPTSEHNGFTLDSKKRTVKDSVLNDFLKTKDVPPTLPRSARAVPSIISGIASRREASSVTGPSLTQDVLAQFSLEIGSAAGTIRSKITPSCSSSVTPTDSSASSIIDVDKQSIDEKEASHEDEEDSLAPLAADLASNSSRLLDGIRSGFDSLRSRAGGGSSPRLSGPLSESFGSSEHVKLKITEGDSNFSVTAYFPRRFKDLRAKCGLSENLFIESLSRCTDLNPSGGKSSAAFLMTGNQRFMLKELVTKFGYSELDSLLTFAPRLLDYQMQADRPSLLSKIFGIYTIKIQDLKTGEKKKLDMIVMDNLFHSQTISRQFDLKGIASRVAKGKPGEEAKEASNEGDQDAKERTTGWDSDWLGSVRDQLLLYPHSRTLLLDAVSNDVEFLSSNGNIDFSLLVGVDDEANTLVVGLIDTLGVFNTLKVLEHSAKKGIKLALASDTSSVTVCPPSEYAKRFLSSMESYFIASPDRWSKAPGSKEDSDPRLACPL